MDAVAAKRAACNLPGQTSSKRAILAAIVVRAAARIA
jgi:hypothetical protein